MLPRLEAQERIDAISAAQIAQPVSGESEFAVQGEIERRTAILDRLHAVASGQPEPEAVPVTSAELAAMGIEVKDETGPASVIADLDAWLGQTPSEASEERLSDG